MTKRQHAPATRDDANVATGTEGTFASAVSDHAASPHVQRHVLGILNALQPDPYLEQNKLALLCAMERQEPYWDLCCALAAYVELTHPRNYLEIGVRRGRSASIVAALAPDIDLFLFDMWFPGYAGVPNPGPPLVRSELKRVGHCGRVIFVTGRSQQTVPAFLDSNQAPKSIDLITVDGDHRSQGARTDLENVIGRLSPGGMIAFDDIAHPEYPELLPVWQTFMAMHPQLTASNNLRDGTGIAVAVRQSSTEDAIETPGISK